MSRPKSPTNEFPAIPPLAEHLAQAAIFGGVAEQVVVLLTGGKTIEQVRATSDLSGLQAERIPWVESAKEPGFSDRIERNEQDGSDFELSRLTKKVRERRILQKRKKKPTTS